MYLESIVHMNKVGEVEGVIKVLSTSMEEIDWLPVVYFTEVEFTELREFMKENHKIEYECTATDNYVILKHKGKFIHSGKVRNPKDFVSTFRQNIRMRHLDI